MLVLFDDGDTSSWFANVSALQPLTRVKHVSMWRQTDSVRGNHIEARDKRQGRKKLRRLRRIDMTGAESVHHPRAPASQKCRTSRRWW
jgi:hypothetical protein